MVVRARVSVASFERLAERLEHCELERGEIIRLSPAGYLHNRAAMNIAFQLESWARRTRRGRVVANETGVVTEERPGTVRGADVVYISYRRLPRRSETEGFIRTPPELVVEVVGKRQGWKRVVQKAGEYFRMGVDRVWLVDPKARRLHVYRPDDEPQVLEANDLLSDNTLLPGFRCRVGRFFDE
jgi:Uma2 family endonuclease